MEVGLLLTFFVSTWTRRKSGELLARQRIFGFLKMKNLSQIFANQYATILSKGVEQAMKELNMFYGAASLRQLRQLCGYTIQQEADMIPCSTRTIDRIEQDNRTSNKATAEKLAEIFYIPFGELFIEAEQHFLDALKSIAPKARCNELLDEMTYYLLYVCRASWWEARIWGKTMWIGQYDVHHELRKLRPLGDNRAVVRYLQGEPDVILLGQYKNRPGIFPVHDIMVGDRN